MTTRPQDGNNSLFSTKALTATVRDWANETRGTKFTAVVVRKRGTDKFSNTVRFLYSTPSQLLNPSSNGLRLCVKKPTIDPFYSSKIQGLLRSTLIQRIEFNKRVKFSLVQIVFGSIVWTGLCFGNFE